MTDRVGDRCDADTGAGLSCDRGAAIAYRVSLRQHAVEIDTDMRGEVDLVHDEQIAADHAGTFLARDVAAARDVDDEDPPVDEIEREGRGEVVAAGLEDEQLD